MQNFRPLEQQEPLTGWPWSFQRNLWQRQNLHNRNIDSNANSIQTSTSPWRRFPLSQRPKILHGTFFNQASTVVRLVRAIVKVWGASRDVLYNPIDLACLPGRRWLPAPSGFGGESTFRRISESFRGWNRFRRFAVRSRSHGRTQEETHVRTHHQRQAFRTQG